MSKRILMDFQITDEQFESTYKPIKNTFDDNASYNGCMFETYGQELAYVLSIANSPDRGKVWTIIDSETGNWPVTVSGYHLVNRIGYLITEIPLADDIDHLEVVDEFEDEDDMEQANDCQKSND